MGNGEESGAVGVVPPVVAGVFLAVTGALLVADLKQPGRFYYLITKGNWTSWLVKGAYILMFFALVCGLWFIGALIGSTTLLQVLAVPAVLGALGTAGYTAFLFGQCEGRDLWQTPLLLPTLLAQAATAGGATYALLELAFDVPDAIAVCWVLLGGLLATSALIAMELTSAGSRHVELAIHEMTKGAYGRQFWIGGVIVGLVIPIALMVITLVFGLHAVLAAVAAVFALVGMFAYEDAFVRAGQSVPLS